MKINVSQEGCIGCGMCIDICPEVFKYNDDFKSEVIPEMSAQELSEELTAKVTEAKEACPVDAIVTEQFFGKYFPTDFYRWNIFLNRLQIIV